MKCFFRDWIYQIVAFLFKTEKKLKFKGLGHYVIMLQIKRNYRYFMHREIDIKNPHDINEKINWLKLNDNYELWAFLADKYKVREYIASKGLNEILIPIYGVWDNANKIKFDSLPKSFVLKTNHGSGDSIIVKDKHSCDLAKIINTLNAFLCTPYGVGQGEPHYLFIKPRVIAEKLLIQTEPFSTSLIDYKIWCFNGKPTYIFVCYSRSKDKVKVETYDLDWIHHPEFSVFNDHYVDGGGIVPKPKNFKKMLEIAAILSEGFKQVRVDLYNVDGYIFFGELTFTSNGGYMNYFTPEFLQEIGKRFDVNI